MRSQRDAELSLMWGGLFYETAAREALMFLLKAAKIQRLTELGQNHSYGLSWEPYAMNRCLSVSSPGKVTQHPCDMLTCQSLGVQWRTKRFSPYDGGLLRVLDPKG